MTTDNKPKAIIQLTAVDPAIKRAFMKEATDYASASKLFEAMWLYWEANHSPAA